MTTRWKLTLEYDGSGFCGWQRQPHAPSVQQTLEEAIQKFCGENARLFVAGRTDTGVHARAQVAHVDLEKQTTGNTLRDAVNFYLHGHAIAVLEAVSVDDTFHARLSAIQRTYRYLIINRRAPLTFQASTAWQVPSPLDTDSMQRAANILLGKHDFSTFRASHCQAKSPIKTLDSIDIFRDGETITLWTSARSFLYHQVRNIVGTLCLVGSGAWSLDDFQKAFAACDRKEGGPTAPAQGLCFWQVSYPQKN
ncbi:MAG: tRNA pseudouridine(38-40) synthase TruA [Alphaproteobacteria bacterium]|nr:tRNA pseudouridine(38-40) synthase TruA [Alphaproteobacteria bacterium]